MENQDKPELNADTIQKIVNRLIIGLRMQAGARSIIVPESDVDSAQGTEDAELDTLAPLLKATEQAGIFIREAELGSTEDVFAFVSESNPVLLCSSDGVWTVFEMVVGGSIEATRIGEQNEALVLSRRKVQSLLSGGKTILALVASKHLECDTLSAATAHGVHGNGHHGNGDHGDGHHHEHLPPLRRFIGLLNLDRRDIRVIFLFALAAGVLALATPLAIESLVNVVSWGTYVQPLIWLGLMLLTCLGIAGVLEILQTIVVEIIQRRQFVRIVSDLAHRFPRANQASLIGEFPRELANRVFDIMTIQKASAVLLLDGVGIILTTVLGLILLAFYHPFLLGFDIVLLISMISITWILGRGGIRTAIAESITKYEVVHWLQDVLSYPSAFKINGGESLAILRADQLTTGYINARRSQFRVVIRQIAFAIALQVIASTAVLAIGGWLVIDGQLTLGQLVASELVVTTVVGAFAKAGKSLEKFYDLMAGIDKVGHLLDIPSDPYTDLGPIAAGPASVRWPDLDFKSAANTTKVPAASIAPGTRLAIVGDDIAGRALLAKSLAGLICPSHGVTEVAGHDAIRAASSSAGNLIAYAGSPEVFNASLRENVDLGRRTVRHDRVRQVLDQVGLSETVLKLRDGMETPLQTGGFPLTELQTKQLMLARAMAASPRLLIVDGLLDQLTTDDRESAWQALAAKDAPWTLVVSTSRSDIAERCDTQIAVRKS